MNIEAVKNEALRKGLFDAVSSALWQAKLAMDYASKHEDGRYPNVEDGIRRATIALAEAQVLHAELLKYSKAKSK